MRDTATASAPLRSRRARTPRQLGLALCTWGGQRKGAGRRPKGGAPGVPHRMRPALASRFPVHVTLRMQPEVWNLRSRRSYRVLERAFLAGAERFGLRLCAYSVQGNHIHLLIEAADRTALSRGMRGLSIRIAKGLNRMMGRKGNVLSDRYHAHILHTPTEVRRAMVYVRENQRQHRMRRGEAVSPDYVDCYASGSKECRSALPSPHTWLLREGYRRGTPARHEGGIT